MKSRKCIVCKVWRSTISILKWSFARWCVKWAISWSGRYKIPWRWLLVDKFEFVEENDFIFDKKVVTDIGEFTKTPCRSDREPAWSERRKFCSSPQWQQTGWLPWCQTGYVIGSTRCWVSPKHRWVYRAGYLQHRSRKQRRCLSSAAIHGKTDDMLGSEGECDHRSPDTGRYRIARVWKYDRR